MTVEPPERPAPAPPQFVRPGEELVANHDKPSWWTGSVKPTEGWYKRASRLLKLSWRLVAQDRRLLVFPAAAATLSLLFGGLVVWLAMGLHVGPEDKQWVLGLVLGSAPATFFTIVCGVATSALVNDLLDGREPSPRRALALVRRRLGVILAWTFVLWTIGAVLKLIQDRIPLGARILTWIAELAFTIATLFVIPILAAEGLGPRDAFKRSTELLRQRYGALLAGSAVLGAGSFLLVIPGVVPLCAGIAMGGTTGTILIAAALAYVIAVQSFMTSLDYAFRTVLYRDAVGLPTDRAGLSPQELTLPFTRA